jgi:MFS family permease
MVSNPKEPLPMPAAPDKQGRLRWLVLALIGVAQLMVVLDATIVNIALPSAQADLGFSDGARQWIITAYALAFGSLLLVGGRLGDLLGRKRVFVIGLTGFAAASAIGGFAPNFGVLVVARALQGAFAALLAPAALSILTTTFTVPEERNRAFGVFGTIAASGAAVGLILGGALTQYLDWRWSMFINVLFAAPAALAALPPRPRRAGVLGIAHRRGRDRDGLRRPVRARVRLLERGDARVGRAGHDRRRRGRRRPAGRLRGRRAPHRQPAAAAARRRRPQP